MPITDESLIDCYKWARRLALMISGNATDAEDIVQEAFLQAIIHRSEVDPEAIRGWLRTVMTRHYLRRRWRRARERELLAQLRDWPRGFAESQLDEDIVNGLTVLSPRQRACIVLRYLEDLPEREIGVILNISEGTVKAHLAHGRSQLRSRLRG